MPLALADSRRLTGPSVLLDRPGAVLDVRVGEGQAGAVVEAWRRHLARYAEAVGWGEPVVGVRTYAGGASLAFEAPIDVLYAATEVNEAAWDAAVAEIEGGDPRVFDAEAQRLHTMIEAERNPALIALQAAAAERGVTLLSDDERASVGMGTGARTWPVGALPTPAAVDWAAVHDVPVALVTGTNGKSTTVRLLAAVLRAAGRVPGATSTDRIVVGADVLDRGDYSGPGGARTVLRDTRVEAAVLEVARGGVLRRGLGTPRASAAAVTNVADDHLGEYGVDTVEELARAKFVVARALGEGGVLVTYAEDPYCHHEAHRLTPLLDDRGVGICWTALDPEHERLAVHRRREGAACAVVDGHLAYSERGRDWTPVVPVSEVPVALGGAARYNVRNALTALGLARALGIEAAAVADGLRAFRSDPDSNPGRSNVFDVGEARVLVDFAHNAHGLEALCEAVDGLPARRRLVLLSHAGDRTDGEITALGRAAARLQAAHYVVADLPGHLRGREAGAVPALITRALREAGIASDAIERAADPAEGTRRALGRAQPGDLLLLLVLSHRDEAVSLVRQAAAEARR